MQTAVVVCVVLLAPALLAGQSEGSGILSGTVTNMQTAGPLSGASVILHLNTAEDLAATAATDAQGHFSFDHLPAGAKV